MSLILRSNDGQRALVPFFRAPSLLDEIDALTGETWDSWNPFKYVGNLLPQTDLYEEKGNLVMKAELPGISEKELDITLEGDRLTVKAEKKEETVENATHHACGRYYGQYFRSVTLPYPVKEEGVLATMENGVLEIRMPKAEETKAKKIEVKAQLPKGRRKAKKEK
jgi:HSP20 family protein